MGMIGLTRTEKARAPPIAGAALARWNSPPVRLICSFGGRVRKELGSLPRSKLRGILILYSVSKDL
jgi:hypothetical protein